MLKPRAQAIHDDILQAAEQQFALHGYKGTTMQCIANYAKLPKSNLHYYFKNKLTLYIAVLERIISRWDQGFNQMVATDDPKIVLTQYIKNKLLFSIQNPAASKLFAQEILSGGQQLQQFFQQGYHHWFVERTQIFESWIHQKKMDDIHVEHLIFMIWACTQHYADFALQITAALDKTALSSQDFDSAADTLCHIILKGCGIR